MSNESRDLDVDIVRSNFEKVLNAANGGDRRAQELLCALNNFEAVSGPNLSEGSEPVNVKQLRLLIRAKAAPFENVEGGDRRVLSLSRAELKDFAIHLVSNNNASYLDHDNEPELFARVDGDDKLYAFVWNGEDSDIRNLSLKEANFIAGRYMTVKGLMTMSVSERAKLFEKT